MCAGVTAYTACKRSGLRSGQWLVVQGAGGGLGQFALQYARVMVDITSLPLFVSLQIKVLTLPGYARHCD